MYNLYSHSTTVSLKTRPSLSFSFNDHQSYSYNGTYLSPSPSSCCCCCCCCSSNCCSSIPLTTCSVVVPINPSLPFGFRQSTLIQWPPSRRRLILSGGDRCGYGAPVQDPGRTRISYGADRRVREDSKKSKGKGSGLLGYRRRVFEERLVFRRIGAASEDAEAMISLLTEQVGKEFKKGNVRDDFVKDKSRVRKGGGLESVEAQHWKEGCSTRHEREDGVMGEYSRLRKQGSSGSSYYSCSDSGDNESVLEGVIAVNGQAKNERHRNQDQRKRYIKKFSEDSVEETVSRKGAVLNQSTRSEAHVSGSEKASRMNKQYSNRREESISDVNLSDPTYRYEYLTRSSGRVDENSTSSSKKVNDREENAVSSCVFCTTCGQTSTGNQTRSNSEQRSKISQIQEDNIKFLNVETHTESNRKRLEESSSLLQKSANEVNEQQERHTASGRINFKNTDTRLNSTVGQQSETRIKTQEESSALLQTSLEHVNENNHRENLVATSRTDLMRKSQNRSNIADTGASYVQNSSRTQQQEEARLKISEENPVSFISSQHAKGEQHQTAAQISTQNCSRNSSKDVSGGSQVNIRETISTGNSQSASDRVKSVEERIETSEQVNERLKQMYLRYELQRPRREASFHEKETSNLTSTSQIRIEEIGDEEVERNLLSSPSSPSLAPPRQSIERDNVYADSASRFTLQDSGSYMEPSHLVSRVDLLESAEQMDKSSLQVIDDFVEKARNETTTSGTHLEKKLSERQLVNEGTTKGPTEEMWSLQEPPKGAASESAANPVNVVDGRSGRTLWNILGHIARLRWGHRAESHKSPVKSGGRSSSSDSPGSEAWFSGHDPDESQGSDVKRATSSTPQELPDARLIVDSALSSSSDERTSQVTAPVDWSQPAAGLFRRSYRKSLATIELQEGGKEAIGSGRVDQIKDDIDSTPTEASGSEEHVMEQKQRRLLRNKQVMRERFDEWEDAYRQESEQRKLDEFFMREALEEAKKAADMWEVPVGAVLVRDRKIIARGYNLVEDLRDSTAHAEMICIREASNILQTWRLSDTTLYVTLEPCAMCAGAILQARMGTLVYGAPNKLLGADGSWIRLFPSSSVGGEGGSESMAKPEGPVHPFHSKMTIRRGILEAECADVMQQFFRLRRKKDKKPEQPEEHHSTKKLLHPSKLLHDVFHFLFCL